MRSLYIQFREEKNGWKEKILNYYRPIKIRNVENDQELEIEEKIVDLPRWKKKEKVIRQIEECQKKEKIDQIIFSKEMKKYLGQEVIKKENDKIARKINRCLLAHSLMYILEKQDKETQNVDLYFLVNEYSQEMKDMLSYFSYQYKLISILSKKQKHYIRWIEKMEEKEQSNLIYSRNYRKSLTKAKIIINIDFGNQDLQKFKINPNAILINLSEESLTFQQVFNGIIVNGIEVEVEAQKLGIYTELNSYATEEIYFNRINTKLSYEEITRKIKKDGVKVEYLKGINGRINEKEYKCIG